MKPVKTYAGGKPHYINESDGSYTINCKKGEAKMSMRSFGMVGKTYKSASEAFKDADWCIAIETPEKSEYSYFWSLMAILACLGIIAYLAITHF